MINLNNISRDGVIAMGHISYYYLNFLLCSFKFSNFDEFNKAINRTIIVFSDGERLPLALAVTVCRFNVKQFYKDYKSGKCITI